MSRDATVQVDSDVLLWAVSMSGIDTSRIDAKYPKWRRWLEGDLEPTFSELEKFSNTLRIPLGYFFLSTPPIETDYRPEFRTFGNLPVTHMSNDLREVLLINQARQEWYRDYMSREGLDPNSIVGSIVFAADIKTTADEVTKHLSLGISNRTGTFQDVISGLISRVEGQGILVARTGYAGSSTQRTLDPNEFRGFALCDTYAPLIFVNGADTKPAQVFTIVHEWLHIAVAQSGLFVDDDYTHKGERWANKVIGEVLAPASYLRGNKVDLGTLFDQSDHLSDELKCSPLVIALSARDAGLVTRDEYLRFESWYLKKLQNRPREKSGSSGGDYYRSKPYQTSRRFAEAIVEDTWRSGTTFTEAMRLLQIKSPEKLSRFAESLGML